MKRKINRVGQNTLTVSLPAKWVKNMGFKAGDELEVHEDGNKLIVAGSLKLPKKEITIKIPKNATFLRRFLYIPYVKGYDVIYIKYDDTQLYERILQASKLMMGFEVVENTNNSCKIMNISTKLEQNFEILLSRLFTGGITFAQELLERIEHPDEHAIKNLLEYEFNVNKLSLFCRRVIQTGNVGGMLYTPISLYSMVGHLEEIADCYRQIVEAIDTPAINLNKQTKELFKNCIKQQELNFKIYNRLMKGGNSMNQIDLFNEVKHVRENVQLNQKYFNGDRFNSFVCGKLLEVIELSHHINEELFY